MFNESLVQPRAEALRLQREELLHQRLWPDSPARAEWLQHLAGWLERGHREEPLQPELLVPDGCAALLLRDGQPPAWLRPGRHPLASLRGLAEVRLIPLGLVPQAFRDRPDLALDLPWERALHFADGEQLAILKAGNAHGSRLLAGAASSDERRRLRAPAPVGEEDLVQGYSFV
jgi:hypothetical protein